MFGYVTIAAGMLDQEQQTRYRAAYCGLCHTLGERYGALGRFTLSYDATFLYLLLNSLYEPSETQHTARCLPHPFKPHTFVCSEPSDYCCDINIMLAYHKALDNQRDEHSLSAAAQAKLLESAYRQVERRHPDKCRIVAECLSKLHELEQRGEPSPDAAANLTAHMLGTLYRYREDLWSDTLTRVGEGLGRFIYLMDAYDDLESDRAHKRYNPLLALSERADYEELLKESLTLMIAECTDAFETLPLVKDMDILRNILYAGCWTRYELKRQQRDRKRGVPAPRKERSSTAFDHKEDGV